MLELCLLIQYFRIAFLPRNVPFERITTISQKPNESINFELTSNGIKTTVTSHCIGVERDIQAMAKAGCMLTH